MKILRIDSSARYEKSVSRDRADIIIEQIRSEHEGATVVTRDVAKGLPFVDAEWVAAKNSQDRTTEQEKALALSYELIEELEAADTYVFSIPVYNFSVPATLKAWADLVALPRRTFRYTENGPEGLLKGKRAVLVFASGGTEIGSEIDYASSWFEFFLGFIGVNDVTILGGKGDIDRDALLEAYNA